MKISFTLFAFALFLQSGYSQTEKHSFQVPMGGRVVVEEVKNDFFPILQNFEAPFPGGEAARLKLDEMRKAKRNLRPNLVELAPSNKVAVPDLWASRQIDGNRVFEGVPNDNDFAISNGGKIVSVINSNIFMYDLGTDAITQQISLHAFSSSLNLPSSKYDPRMRYDPRNDRFVMVFLSGTTDTTNNIVVAFSQTNNPTGAWSLYALPGNPLNDTTWTDYPIIALTEKELFITGNLLKTGLSWQLGFSQSIVWQIRLEDGYRGDSLVTQLWTGIQNAGTPIRNLCPVQGGSTTYGPDIYLLSDKNFSTSTDSFFVLHISDSLQGNDTLSIEMIHADNSYGAAPLARQRFNTYLETNDARVLSSYIENGKIQFAGNTVNPDTNTACIFHGTVSGLSGTKSIALNYIREDSMEFGYPNLSFAGTGPSDHQCILTFNHTASHLNPGLSGVFVDNNGDYSARLVIKEGLNYINVQTGSVERWGDYSGSQRKFDEPGKVWGCGTYGRTDRTHGTWIAELNNPELFVGTKAPAEEKFASSIFPNPANERVNLSFQLPEAKNCEIALYDLLGNRVETFILDRVKSGLNEFSCSTQSLENGVYFLRISSESEILANQKFIIQK